MQKIEQILQINGVAGNWTDEYGKTISAPIITLGMQYVLKFDLRTTLKDPENGTLLPIPFEDVICGTYYIALDMDYKQETAPKLLINTDGITVNQENGKTFFVCQIPNTAVDYLIAAISNAKTIKMSGEIGGFAAGKTVASFVHQFEITLQNRVWLGLTPPEYVQNDPEYPTFANIKAWLAQSPEIQYSADGLEKWHSIPDFDTDNFTRWRIGGNGNWAAPQPLPRGRDGKSFAPSSTGLLADRPATPENGYCYLASDTRELFWFFNGSWTAGTKVGVDGKGIYELAVESGFVGTPQEYLASLKGADGKGIYELAVESGFVGTPQEYLASLKGEKGNQGNNGKNSYELAVESGFIGTPQEYLASLKGADGRDYKPDATGTTPTERAAYGTQKKGFIFAASVENKTERNTKVYVYVKKTDEINDWCDPMVITYYSTNGKNGENIALIRPVEFVRPETEFSYFSCDMTKFPAATVAAVCIDTAEGELRLPYDSALGITKIIKDNTGKIYMYFGSLCPMFKTGRVYFAQGSSGLTQYQWYVQNGGKFTFEEWVEIATKTIPDAPKDGNSYLRCNGQWVKFSGGNVTPPDITDAIYYGYIPASVAGNASSVLDITKAMLDDPKSSIVVAGIEFLDKKSLGVIPAGAWVVVFIPHAAAMKAQKLDGIGNFVPFDENSGIVGNGANGASVTLNTVEYEIYGQFNLATSEISIRIINKE